jgi:3-oxo-4,17-pregnadiene-20-carboxyl-CoA hydratase alpha subunit
VPDRALEQAFAAYVGQPFGTPEVGRDAVNEPMIRQWCDAMGDRNPIYWDAEAAAKSVHGGVVAPPTMLQAWILSGFRMANADRPPADRQEELHALFQKHGYTGVVATNCEQEYVRYLRPGERVSAEATIESISEEKATALGIGYFVETRTRFTDQNGEEVGSMVFRVLKFKPAQQPLPQTSAPAVPGRIRAPRSFDNGWWWEGVDKGLLLIQKCKQCGELRHPPRPMCHVCHSTEWEGVPSGGQGSVNSWVVLHHPPIPGYELPLAIAVIDLEEGTRVVANIVDCPFEEIHIDMPVECSIEEIEPGYMLPVFRRVA